jgi:assimilatory nitrate reductase catalytic subunit
MPGSDVALYNAMLHVMLWEGLMRQRFHRATIPKVSMRCATVVRDMIRRKPSATQICGVKARRHRHRCALVWRSAARVPLSMWCQGLNQSSQGTQQQCRADPAASRHRQARHGRAAARSR